jgi:hypothetical protein
LKTDTVYLRRHYASLSDEALLDVDETDLVEDARQIYDTELAQRGLTRQETRDDDDQDSEASPIDRAGDRKPDWLGDAAVAARYSASPGRNSTDDALEARDALEAAGIPCYLSTTWVDPPPVAEPRKELRLMVPGNLNFEAESVLDMEIFNREAEAMWKTHLQALSDEELSAVDLQLVFAGRRDWIERVTAAYREELAQREITPPQ